jgi:flagellar protein FliS
MTALANRGIESYRRTAIEGSTPVDLIVMLYDGALRFGAEARAALLRRDIRARATAISKMLGIVGELQGTLDLDRGGSIAASLNGLYSYVSRLLVEASAKQDVALLDEAVRLLSTLREGWTGAREPERTK